VTQILSEASRFSCNINGINAPVLHVPELPEVSLIHKDRMIYVSSGN
jgi:hypothetical protein